MTAMPEGISYEQAEFLVKVYPQLLALLRGLKLDYRTLLARVVPDLDDVIYSLGAERRSLDPMPPPTPGVRSDPTARAAETYRKVATKEQEEARRRLSNDILDLSLVLDKVDVALGALSHRARSMLKAHYWEDKPWREVASEQHLSVSRCMELRMEALLAVARLVRLDDDLYLRVTRMLASPANKEREQSASS